MAQTAKRSTIRGLRSDPPTSFDVVSVIGTVQLDKSGTENPDLAAFRIIAEHGNPGEFTFPNIHGADTRVTVETPPQDTGVTDRYAPTVDES